MLTEGGPQLYHVDNGLTLNYGKAYHPDYLDDYRQSAGLRTHMDLNPIHPAAIQWLNTLNPNVFAQHLANNGVPGELSQQAIQRLQTAQAMVNSGRSNWGQVWNSNYYGED